MKLNSFPVAKCTSPVLSQQETFCYSCFFNAQKISSENLTAQNKMYIESLLYFSGQSVIQSVTANSTNQIKTRVFSFKMLHLEAPETLAIRIRHLNINPYHIPIIWSSLEGVSSPPGSFICPFLHIFLVLLENPTAKLWASKLTLS